MVGFVKFLNFLDVSELFSKRFSSAYFNNVFSDISRCYSDRSVFVHDNVSYRSYYIGKAISQAVPFSLIGHSHFLF